MQYIICKNYHKKEVGLGAPIHTFCGDIFLMLMFAILAFYSVYSL